MTTRTKKPVESPAEKAPKNPRNAAYSNAERRLREAHPEEFRALHKEETEKLGLVYRPTMTAEERAEAKRQEALAKARQRLADAQAVIEALGGDVTSEEEETEPDPLA
jgi:23S rRNA G2069 N7-methylase RlmK/C1962 C5-methylase RlmI